MRCNQVRRLTAAVIAPLLLLTTGCFGGESDTESTKPTRGTIEDVSVTGGYGEQPVIKFAAPMSFEKTQNKVLVDGPGAGDHVLPDSVVKVDYAAVNASDGNTFSSSWSGSGGPQTSTFEVSQVFKGFLNGLEGATAGDRVLMTVPSSEAFDPTGNSEQTVRNGDSVIMVVDVKHVDNPTVVPPSRLPTLTFDKDGNPKKFVAQKDTPRSVGLLSQKTLRTGDGPTVGDGDTVTVRYLGQLWPDGAVFDSNYADKKPTTLSLSTTITGWQQGLVGKTVGSRIVLAIPSEQAYGSAGSTQGTTIPPNADLIFVIDIIKTKAPSGQ
jgi:peptidylprolyl isomerase